MPKTKTETKACISCETQYPMTSEFYSTDVSKADMCHDTCRFCLTQAAEAVSTRICRDCGASKTLPEFAKTPHGNDEYGRMQSCRDCWSGKISKARQRAERKRRRTPKEEAMAAAPTSPTKKSTKKKRRKKKARSTARAFTKRRTQPEGAPDRKTCTACNREKTWKSFYADRKNDDRLNRRCIDCCRKGRKGTRRPITEHVRTLPNGDKVLIAPKGRRAGVGRVPPLGLPAPTKRKPKRSQNPLSVKAVTIDALLAEREADIRADEREKVLAEIDSRYILVEKPE